MTNVFEFNHIFLSYLFYYWLIYYKTLNYFRNKMERNYPTDEHQ